MSQLGSLPAVSQLRPLQRLQRTTKQPQILHACLSLEVAHKMRASKTILDTTPTPPGQGVQKLGGPASLGYLLDQVSVSHTTSRSMLIAKIVRAVDS